MALTPSEVGLAGMALGALGYVCRGLIDLLLRKKDTTADIPQQLLAEMESFRRVLQSHIEDDETAMAALENSIKDLQAESKQMLQLHQSESSIFATVETNRLLNRMLTSFAKMEGRLERLG